MVSEQEEEFRLWDRDDPCPDCNGTGTDPDHPEYGCAECDGTGDTKGLPEEMLP